MTFNKDDENYIYGVVGLNVKKYRKEKKLTQAKLAEKINYSLSFVSGLESKKHQSFSLGALYRISLILGVDMYKFFIDEDNKNLETNNIDNSNFKKYKCNRCDYETEIPYDLVELIKTANKVGNQLNSEPIFKCKHCDGYIVPTNNNL